MVIRFRHNSFWNLITTPSARAKDASRLSLDRAATPPRRGGEKLATPSSICRRSAALIGAILLLLSACSSKPPSSPGTEVTEVRIPRGAGGVGFLPLLVMEKDRLIEKQARADGISSLTVKWIDLGGPAVMNEALLSGSVDFIAAGPPAFLILWDRTRDSAKVLGVAAMSSLPMYLNTRSDRFKKLDDVTDKDKIAVTAI